MIKIYTSPSCASCRKVKKWMKDKNILFSEKNILVHPLKEKDIKELLNKTENGTDDILSKRSKVIKTENIDIDSMNMRDLILFIQKNPTVLKRPIIIDEKRMLIGYHKEELFAFIPQG